MGGPSLKKKLIKTPQKKLVEKLNRKIHQKTHWKTCLEKTHQKKKTFKTTCLKKLVQEYSSENTLWKLETS